MVKKQRRQSRKTMSWARKILIAVLLILGLALLFNKPIRNTLIAWNSNKYQVTKVSKRRSKKIRKSNRLLIFRLLSQSAQKLFYKHKWLLKNFLL